MTVFEKIEAQQKELEKGSAPWVVGEQLKEICQSEPESAELLDKDLDAEGMSLKKAEAKIKAYADAHKTGNFSYVSPQRAEEILREFYGLPSRGAAQVAAAPKSNVIDLNDWL